MSVGLHKSKMQRKRSWLKANDVVRHYIFNFCAFSFSVATTYFICFIFHITIISSATKRIVQWIPVAFEHPVKLTGKVMICAHHWFTLKMGPKTNHKLPLCSTEFSTQLKFAICISFPLLRAVFFREHRKLQRRAWQSREAFSRTGCDRRSGTLCCCLCTPSSHPHQSPSPRQQSQLRSQQTCQSEIESNTKNFWNKSLYSNVMVQDAFEKHNIATGGHNNGYCI